MYSTITVRKTTLQQKQIDVKGLICTALPSPQKKKREGDMQ